MKIGKPSGELKFRKQKARVLLHRCSVLLWVMPFRCLHIFRGLPSYFVFWLEHYLSCNKIPRHQCWDSCIKYNIPVHLPSYYYELSTVLSATDLTSIKHCLQIAVFYRTRHKQIHFIGYIICFSESPVSTAYDSSILWWRRRWTLEGKGNFPPGNRCKGSAEGLTSIFQEKKGRENISGKGRAGCKGVVWGGTCAFRKRPKPAQGVGRRGWRVPARRLRGAVIGWRSSCSTGSATFTDLHVSVSAFSP